MNAPAAHRMIPLTEPEVRMLIEERDRLLSTLKNVDVTLKNVDVTLKNVDVTLKNVDVTLLAYEGLVSKVAVDYARKIVRAAIAAADQPSVDTQFRQILATGQPLSSYGRPDHDMDTSGMPLRSGT